MAFQQACGGRKETFVRASQQQYILRKPELILEKRYQTDHVKPFFLKANKQSDEEVDCKIKLFNDQVINDGSHLQTVGVVNDHTCGFACYKPLTAFILLCIAANQQPKHTINSLISCPRGSLRFLSSQCGMKINQQRHETPGDYNSSLSATHAHVPTTLSMKAGKASVIDGM